MDELRNGNMVAKFKTHLKDLMKEHGVKRMELVREHGFSYPTVVKWESEGMQNLDADLVLQLMNKFKVGLDDLVYVVEEDQ